MLAAPMTRLPRFRDDLHVQKRGEDAYLVTEADGAEVYNLSTEGYYILGWLDGINKRERLEEDFRERFERDLPIDELDQFLHKLDRERCLVAEGPHLRVLRELADFGVAFRHHRPDRRDDGRIPKGPRRDHYSEQQFDLGVLHLNAGRLRQAHRVFRGMADQLPEVTRVEQIALCLERHLGDSDLLAEQDPTLDERLQKFIEHGACPYCGHELDILLGAAMRCVGCGASYASPVIPT